MHFLKVFSFMFEHASSTVWTVKSILKTLAVFTFVLVVIKNDSAGHLTIAMGELAFLSVTAAANFNPILAHFCFVLGAIYP